MNTLTADAGRAALKAFLSALLAIAPGLWVAPDLNGATALGIAALMAGIAAAVAAAQIVAPRLSFRSLVPGLPGALLDSFAHAFVGAFAVAITGWLAMPDLTTWKAVLLGALVGGLDAAMRAVQGFLTPGEAPSPTTGFTPRGAAWRDAPAPRRVLLPA